MDIAVILALVASIGIVAGVLLRQRSRVRPDDYQPAESRPTRRQTKHERLLQKLSPLPEIPTVMDLMREEMAETGVETIPGHEGLAGPVMLKVYRRDDSVREKCPHDAYEFVIRDGIDAAEATEDDVVLFCSQCGPVSDDDVSGTDSEDVAL